MKTFNWLLIPFILMFGCEQKKEIEFMQVLFVDSVISINENELKEMPSLDFELWQYINSDVDTYVTINERGIVMSVMWKLPLEQRDPESIFKKIAHFGKDTEDLVLFGFNNQHNYDVVDYHAFIVKDLKRNVFYTAAITCSETHSCELIIISDKPL